MATSTQTKPAIATAPVSKTPPAETTPKSDVKPRPSGVTKIIVDPGRVLHGAMIKVENDVDATEPVLDGPAVADSNAAPQLDTSAPAVTTPTTFDLADSTVLTIRKGGTRVRPLSKQEVDEFEMCEAAVDEGLPKFLAVGEALYLISQKKLYRAQYKTFAEYCEKRFGLSRQNAYMQIDAARVTENLSTNGLQIPAGTTERVLRPLANQTAEVQVEAWTLVQAKSAGKRISGKDVEVALKEVLGGMAQEQAEEDWYTITRNRFTAAGYKTNFDQPVSLGEDEWIDFLDGEGETYIKIVEQPTLSSLGICVAMRENHLKYRVVVNANNIRKANRTLAKDGTLTHLLEPGTTYFVHLLGAYVEHDGKLYEPELFEQGYKLKLKRASSDDPTELGEVPEAQTVPQTADE